MRITKGLAAASLLALTTGCASIVNDSHQVVRVETYDEKGAEVKDASCRLENDGGVFTVSTPGQAMVKRSDADLAISCVAPNHADAKGSAISRANAGLAGNILFGGGIGAIIDHSRGTAYTYPQWVRLVMGKMLSFDRRADVEGQPNAGTVPETAQAAGAGPSTATATAAPAK